MKRAIQFGLMVSLFLTVGCSQLPLFGRPVSVMNDKERAPEIAAGVRKGSVMDAQALKDGKNIAVIPFTAGVGITADNALDKIALMIVKGLSDAIADGGGEREFLVLTAENIQEADFVVQGRIDSMKVPSRMRRWVLLEGRKSLGVSGKMINAKTGEAVLVFNDDIQTVEKSESHNELGYRIGKNIGLFILSAANKI
ncbi:MAG TPA: hypothetical protein PKV41_05810, partial [Candidatus Omnitrophota bacterium]|nr:hypothetical protein [Candidatus Omnitrophota bacterium]